MRLPKELSIWFGKTTHQMRFVVVLMTWIPHFTHLTTKV
jgi:hypothetical protein